MKLKRAVRVFGESLGKTKLGFGGAGGRGGGEADVVREGHIRRSCFCT